VKRKTYNVVPVTFSVLLHAGVFASLFLVIDFDRTPDIAIPLAINATLVTENAVVTPPKAEDSPKVVEPPKVETPPPPDVPDIQEEQRRQAEQEKREQDARDEVARLQKIEDEKAEAEKKRLAEAEKQRKEAAAEEERLRIEAEEKRQADIERQRLENERLRKELEEAERQKELQQESQRVQAMAASAKSAYIFAIQQKIKRNWVRPANAEVGLECVISVQQTASGEVINVSFGSCNGDATIRRSIEAAVFKASPLPAPRDPSVFDRDIRLTFRPEE
jgi:colicin import membrane protein